VKQGNGNVQIAGLLLFQ